MRFSQEVSLRRISRVWCASLWMLSMLVSVAPKNRGSLPVDFDGNLWFQPSTRSLSRRCLVCVSPVGRAANWNSDCHVDRDSRHWKMSASDQDGSLESPHAGGLRMQRNPACRETPHAEKPRMQRNSACWVKPALHTMPACSPLHHGR